MKRFLFWLWQWTWGLPQSLLATVIFLCNRKRPRSRYRNSIVIHWKKGGSLGLGIFLFLGTGATGDRQRPILAHEYGHALQSLILGPLFLPVIGLPSFLWCNLPWARRYRREKQVSYCRFYTESNANWLAHRITGEETPV